MRRVVCGLLVLLAGPLTGCTSRATDREAPAVLTVLTQHLYVGGDITAPIRAASGRRGAPGLLALGHATAALRVTVDRTGFGVRAGLLANGIARLRPDAVGLQEVALWRHGPLQLDQGPAGRRAAACWGPTPSAAV